MTAGAPDAPYGEVVVGTDGSPTATCAVWAATGLAAALATPLSIATAWYRDRPDGPPPSVEASYPGTADGMEAGWAGSTVSDAAGIARGAGVEDVRQHTPEGNAADALVELAHDRPDSLVVVGTLGLDSTAERLLGNIPHQLTHHARRDVFLVTRGECDGPVDWGTVALATDGSDTAARACRRGLAVAGALGAAPTLLTVDPSRGRAEQILATAADRLGVDGVDQHAVAGRDTSGLLAGAAADYDLLVIGNKGMSGASRLLGSVANRVTHHTTTDTLLVNTTG